MKRLMVFLLLTASVTYGQSMTAQKTYSYETALQKVEAFLKAKNLTIFSKVDHADGAKKVGQEMPKSKLYVFGNPKAGTPLMVENPVWAVHLPLKAAVYEDNKGRVFIAVSDVKALAAKDKLSPAGMEVIGKMDKLLNDLLDLK